MHVMHVTESITCITCCYMALHALHAITWTPPHHFSPFMLSMLPEEDFLCSKHAQYSWARTRAAAPAIGAVGPVALTGLWRPPSARGGHCRAGAGQRRKINEEIMQNYKHLDGSRLWYVNTWAMKLSQKEWRWITNRAGLKSPCNYTLLHAITCNRICYMHYIALHTITWHYMLLHACRMPKNDVCNDM